MTKRRPNQKQHTVPRTYLTNFTDSRGSLWMFNPSLRIYKNAPQNTLTKDFYYNVTFGGSESLIIEKGFLGQVESEFSQIYRNKIAKRLRLTDEEKAKVSLFIAAQLNRVPGRRDSMVNFINQVEKMTKPFMNLSDEEKRKFAKMSPPSVSDGESMPVSDLLSIRDNINSTHSAMLPQLSVDIAPIIFQMRWAFMTYEKGDNSFITSDDPVTIVNPDLEMHYGIGHMWSSPGLEQEGVELKIPLSPTVSLLCGWRLKSDRAYVPVTSQMVDDSNKRHLRHGSLIITNSQRHAEAIKCHLLKRKRMYSARNVLSKPLQEIRNSIVESSNP